MKKCIKQCLLNKDNICAGCKRTLKEIAEAGNISKQKRKQISETNK